jgi:hypothetical protein
MQIIDELCSSRETIRKRLGLAPTAFFIPYGQSLNRLRLAGKLAHQAGYKLPFAHAEDKRPSAFVTCFDGDRIFNALICGTYD